jgi:methylglyoxal synthase
MRGQETTQMADVVMLMPSRKRIALIAHDNCKAEMLEWAEFNRDTLATHELHATARPGRCWPTNSGSPSNGS